MNHTFDAATTNRTIDAVKQIRVKESKNTTVISTENLRLQTGPDGRLTLLPSHLTKDIGTAAKMCTVKSTTNAANAMPIKIIAAAASAKTPSTTEVHVKQPNK